MKIRDTNTGKVYDFEPYQVVALEHLRDNPAAVLFLEMSLSKTAITLTYISQMPFAKVLVVAPKKVATITWPDEVKKWEHLNRLKVSVINGTEDQRIKALNATADIYTIAANNVTWLIDRYLYKKSGRYVGELPFDCIVLDELTLFKSSSSKRFKLLRRAIQSIYYRIGLTGTPSPNGLVDLWAQICLIDDGARLGKTFTEFTDKYFSKKGNGMIVYKYTPKVGAANEIAKRISDIALSMNTRDHIDMPDLHIVDEVLTFTPEERAKYDFLEEEYVLEMMDSFSDITVRTAADLSNKLMQLSSGAVYTDKQGTWVEVNTLKLDTLGDIFDEHPGDNFLIAYQYTHEVERVMAKYPFVRKLNTEEDFRAWNRGEVRALMFHPASAGHGLNLQFGGNRIIFFSTTWNLEHYLQVIGRLLRRGALKDIYVHRLIVKGTRDIKVCNSLGDKNSSQKFLMNEVKELRAKYG